MVIWPYNLDHSDSLNTVSMIKYLALFNPPNQFLAYVELTFHNLLAKAKRERLRRLFSLLVKEAEAKVREDPSDEDTIHPMPFFSR